MAGKQDFTAEEWSRVLEGTMVAGVAVTAAEPHGLWGTLQEGFANAKGLAAGHASTTPLIRDVVAALETSEGRTIARDALKQKLAGVPAAGIASRCLTEIAEIARIVDAKGGADARPFKQWMYANAERVAEAAKEGGFLGFGGVRVSDKEKAALADISKALAL